MRRTGLLAALAASVALTASPAVAAPKPTGPQLGLISECVTSSPVDPQPADAAFHVVHGWVTPVPEYIQHFGQYRFDLAIDGEELRGLPVVERIEDHPDGVVLLRRYQYNFPDGLSAGTYTFDLAFTAPDEAPIEGFRCTLEIEFS